MTDLRLPDPLVVINLGISVFAETLTCQGVEVVQVDWQPVPPAVTEEIVELLQKIL